MSEQVLQGTSASPGVAAGVAWRLDPEVRSGATVPPDRRERELAAAMAALSAAGDALTALADGLPPGEAEIVITGSLMAQDPALSRAVEEAVVSEGLTAGDAIMRATGEHADAIAAVGDETLAARADDVRSLGRRAARLTTDEGVGAPAGTDLIVVAHDLGPADVAELAAALAGVALAGGATTSHAAIVARSLGIPMVTGLYKRALEITDGAPVVLDGSSGTLVLDPAQDRTRAARAAMEARGRARRRAHELRDQPAVTTDGRRVTVLANVASVQELEVGLRSGAEGIGLLRTELAFLSATDWPTELQHTDALTPILERLEGRPAVVRVLDFGVDKAPPFLQDVPQRGLELMLAHRDAFIWQLRAIVLLGQTHRIRILLPMVDTPGQLIEARGLIGAVASSLGIRHIPPVGSMVETPTAARHARAIADGSDFLSVGTNDLTATMLGADRFTANAAHAYHPRVLAAISAIAEAARAAGVPIEVCGEAASDPITLPLLVGLGIDELSVGAARVGEVRDWIRRLSAAETAGLARSALTMDDADEVEWAVRRVTAELHDGRLGGIHPSAA